MEIWDVYDENGNLTGETCVRGVDLPAGGYHLVVHVWIRNQRGEYVVSQRAASRPTHALKWECVGGSVVSGEKGFEGALRETLEEVGISLDLSKGKLVKKVTRGTVHGKRYHDILEVWLFSYDGDIPLAQATTDEVAQAKWLTCEEIRALFDQGEMVPSWTYFWEDIINA